MSGRSSKTDACKNSDCTRSRRGSQESPCPPRPLTRWAAETTPAEGSGYSGGWTGCSGCGVQNEVISWDGEDTSPSSGDSKEVVAAEKTLGGEPEIIFGLFCGTRQDITGDGKETSCCWRGAEKKQMLNPGNGECWPVRSNIPSGTRWGLVSHGYMRWRKVKLTDGPGISAECGNPSQEEAEIVFGDVSLSIETWNQLAAPLQLSFADRTL